ncbi:hypothetical protein ABMA10_19265 [Plantibacter sp. RU18]
MHIRGAVALLYIDDQPAWVYKPRSLALDNLLSEIFALLGPRLGTVATPRHPQSIEQDGYGLQEYVRYSSPTPGPQRAAFYEQFGVLTALSYALRFNC